MFPSILPEHAAIIVLVVIVAIALVCLVATFRSKLVTARKEWLELSTLLQQHSLPHCARIMEDLAVDDLPGAFKECEYLLRLLRDPKQAAAALDAVLVAQLPIALSDQARRTAIVKAIGDWIRANAATAAAAGLSVAAPSTT